VAIHDFLACGSSRLDLAVGCIFLGPFWSGRSPFSPPRIGRHQAKARGCRQRFGGSDSRPIRETHLLGFCQYFHRPAQATSTMICKHALLEGAPSSPVVVQVWGSHDLHYCSALRSSTYRCDISNRTYKSPDRLFSTGRYYYRSVTAASRENQGNLRTKHI
jgi:hypothetical protein